MHERVTPPRSADASPRAVPPKDHALLLLPPSSVPPSLSASLAPRWPHGATDRAQTSSFSNLFFFVSPPLFLSASLRPSSLFLPLFFPHAPEARTDQTRSLCAAFSKLVVSCCCPQQQALRVGAARAALTRVRRHGACAAPMQPAVAAAEGPARWSTMTTRKRRPAWSSVHAWREGRARGPAVRGSAAA